MRQRELRQPRPAHLIRVAIGLGLALATLVIPNAQAHVGDRSTAGHDDQAHARVALHPLTIDVNRSVVAGSWVNVSGSAPPSRRPVTVDIRRRCGHGGWNTVSEQRLNAGGRYSTSMWVPRPAVCGLRAVLLGRGRLRLQVSATVEVRVYRAGSLQLSVRGLPAGASAAIVARGPDGYARRVRGTRMLRRLVPGSYTISAAEVNAGSQTLDPVSSVVHATVRPAGVSDATVIYVATSRPPSPSPTPSSSPSPTGPVELTDDFQRSDRDIAGDVTPSGTQYSLQHNQAGTGLVIRDGWLARGTTTSYGSVSEPILIWPLPRAPQTIGAQFAFSPGQTNAEGIVLGACGDGFGRNSVQLEISPTGWEVFYTLVRSNPDDGTAINVLAQGTLPQPLQVDGTSTYGASITVDLATSSAIVDYPGGSTTIANPAISEYWGTQMGVQIFRPKATDGDARFAAIGALLPAVGRRAQ